MSNITELLISRAQSEAWIVPHADKQFTIEPSRLSKEDGDVTAISLPYVYITLPDTTTRFAVYEMGQINPALLGLDEHLRDWIPLKNFVIANKMVINIHVNHRMLLLDSVYIKRNENRNLILAIDYDKNEALLNNKEHSLYFRLYTNQWFSTAAGAANGGVITKGTCIEDASEILPFYTEWVTRSNSGDGNLFTYVNGFYVDNLVNTELQVGDTVEYIHDYSGTGYFDVPINGSPHFQSTIDDLRKILVLAPDGSSDKLEYYDDVEMYICSTEDDNLGNPRSVGVYYSSLVQSDIRMITHRDYAIGSLRALEIILQQDGRLLKSGSFIRVFLRNNVNREASELSDDGNLIKDLYLLDYDTRKSLLVGSAAVIDEWRAENLEDSAYHKWQQSDGNSLSEELLKGVYSFHGLSRIMELPTYSGSGYDLPPSMVNGGRVYHYDANGYMTGFVDVPATTTNYPLPTNVVNIEVVPGFAVSAGTQLDETSLYQNDSVSDVYESRFYRYQEASNWVSAEWGNDYEYNSDGTISWSADHFSSVKIKRLANRFYSTDFVFSDADIGKPFDFFKGTPPFMNNDAGRLTLWMNGRRLIEDVDFVRNKNICYITARDYYSSSTINVHVLFQGAEQLNTKPGVGYVQHRYLNYNDEYNMDALRPRITFIDGKFAPEGDIGFSESRTSTVDPRFREGGVYGIYPLLNHLPETVVAELTTSRTDAFDKDEAISDYLSIYSPELPISGPVIIPGKHGIVSVLMKKLIDDIKDGSLIIDNSALSDVALDLIVNGYSDYLEADLVARNNLNWDFVVAHPSGSVTGLTVSAAQYATLERINQRFLHSKIQLTTYLTIV